MERISVRCEIFQLGALGDEQHHNKFFYHLWNIKKNKLEESHYKNKLMQLLNPLFEDSKTYEITSIISPPTWYNPLIDHTHIQIDKNNLLKFIQGYEERK